MREAVQLEVHFSGAVTQEDYEKTLIPAIDAAAAATCPAVDQRGVARPQGGGCDAGAVEVAP